MLIWVVVTGVVAKGLPDSGHVSGCTLPVLLSPWVLAEPLRSAQDPPALGDVDSKPFVLIVGVLTSIVSWSLVVFEAVRLRLASSSRRLRVAAVAKPPLLPADIFWLRTLAIRSFADLTINAPKDFPLGLLIVH